MKKRTSYQNEKRVSSLRKTVQSDAPVPEEPPLRYLKGLFMRKPSTKGNLTDQLEDFLRHKFKASSMNIYQTQPLSMMNVPKMTVEFKEETKRTKPKRTSRIIPIPLAMREQTKKRFR